MGLSGRRSRRNQERRRRVWSGLLRGGVLVALVGAIGYYAYAAGLEISRGEVRALQAELANSEVANRQHATEIAELGQALEAARRNAADYEERYKRVVPSPDTERIMETVRQKLAAGAKVDRLAAFIAAADQPRHCEQAVTKRFLVQTDGTSGDNGWVRFANVITVTAEGAAAQSPGGAVEQWYDPAKPVTVKFTMIGGKEYTVPGTLPLQHTIVSGATEYRFTVAAGSRGFAEVAGDTCKARQAP